MGNPESDFLDPRNCIALKGVEILSGGLGHESIVCREEARQFARRARVTGKPEVTPFREQDHHLDTR
jgi:hypothetical protein